MSQVIGAIPEFTQEGTQPEVKPDASVSEETTIELEEKDIPSGSSPEQQPAGEIPPAIEPQPTEPGDDVMNQLKALQLERQRLLREVSELKGQRREIKKEELFKVEDTINELEGVNPADTAVIEKVLRAKGYVTKQESQTMFYESVKQQELTKFLERYPEYKPENDPGDVNWQTLQREISYYKLPGNPHQISDILERAHKMVRPVVTPMPQPNMARRQLEVAGVGGGGVQSSHRSTPKSLSPRYRQELERGGWTEEDIIEIEKNL